MFFFFVITTEENGVGYNFFLLYSRDYITKKAV